MGVAYAGGGGDTGSALSGDGAKMTGNDTDWWQEVTEIVIEQLRIETVLKRRPHLEWIIIN